MSRVSVKELDCECCGHQAEARHHLQPVSMGGGNEDTNLIPLCQPCHLIAHTLLKTNELELCSDRDVLIQGITDTIVSLGRSRAKNWFDHSFYALHWFRLVYRLGGNGEEGVDAADHRHYARKWFQLIDYVGNEGDILPEMDTVAIWKAVEMLSYGVNCPTCGKCEELDWGQITGPDDEGPFRQRARLVTQAAENMNLARGRRKIESAEARQEAAS